MFTNEKNAQIVLALLKKYNVKKIVVSPGGINATIGRSVQIDPWFEVYSVVDERSAAYFAAGLSYETGEVVAISCTGATASRNYLPGLTEAFYRNLPIVAITSQRYTVDYGSLMPQSLDRSVSQNDIKKVSVDLPHVKDDQDYERCIVYTNKALIAATAHGGGPVHINLQTVDYEFSAKKLPDDIRKIEYYSSETYSNYKQELYSELANKKVAVFIGDHKKFDKKLENLIGEFATKFKAPVLVDHTSSYHGVNSIRLAKVTGMKGSINRPDIVIDMGSVTGDYGSAWLNGIETWRLSEDGQVHDRFSKQTKLFDGTESAFFAMFDENPNIKIDYYSELFNETKDLVVPNLPLSNTLVSYELSKRLPKNSNLHLGILNSLRNMNFFELHSSIDVSSNVGGFGIDGPLSTIIGQSMGNKNKLYFGVVGDLAAFYDMNALGLRHIGNNVRILIVNNDGGAEFRLNKSLESQLKDGLNEFVAARGHYGSIEMWAKSMGFEYLSANTKDQLLTHIDQFTSSDINEFKGPVLFEVFTEMSDEQEGLKMIRDENRNKLIPNPTSNSDITTKKSKIKKKLKKVTPEKVKSIYKAIRSRE